MTLPWWFPIVILMMPNEVFALQACSNSVQCPAATPFCLIYATNRTLTQLRSEQKTHANLFITTDEAANLDVKEGFCVQCLKDCHCGVSEFCGIDPDPAQRVKFPNINLEQLPVITSSFNFSQVDRFVSVQS